VLLALQLNQEIPFLQTRVILEIALKRKCLEKIHYIKKYQKHLGGRGWQSSNGRGATK
jgi:hypothetical protein